MLRSSQLQIRISPQQKVTLKRLAGQAGLSVSAYVLSRALPSTTQALEAVLDGLRAGTTPHAKALVAIRGLAEGLSPDRVSESLAEANLSDLTPTTQNYVAGVAEQLSGAAGIQPPEWVHEVPPLEKPHFRWPLISLRPYQLRASPLTLRARNIFDPSVGTGAAAEPTAGPQQSALSRLQALSQHLATLELDVEFYFIGSAIVRQLLPAKPTTSRPRDLFRVDPSLRAQALRPAAGSAWPESWIEDALGQALTPGGVGYLDLPHVRVLRAPATYALAMALAGRQEGDPATQGELRLLLEATNLTSASTALGVIAQYIAERHLATDTRATLESLLPS